MTSVQAAITVGLVVAATVSTRVAPYVLIPSAKSTPKVISYLGKELAPATFILLVVYCLRTTNFTDPLVAVPVVLSLAALTLAHVLRHNMMVSMFVGIASYLACLHLLNPYLVQILSR